MITLDEMKKSSNMVFTLQNKKNNTYNYNAMKIVFVDKGVMYIIPKVEGYEEVLKNNGYIFDPFLSIPSKP